MCVWLPWENEAKNHQENKIFPLPIKKDFLCQFAQMLAISDDSEVTREFRSMHHKTMLLPTNAFSLIYQILQNWLAVIGSYTSKQYDHLHFDASKNRKIYTGWWWIWLTHDCAIQQINWSLSSATIDFVLKKRKLCTHNKMRHQADQSQVYFWQNLFNLKKAKFLKAPYCDISKSLSL